MSKLTKKIKNYLQEKIITNLNKKSLKSKNETYLFWSLGGMDLLVWIEGIIGLALKLRGYNVHFVICDGVYRACASRYDFPKIPLCYWHKSCNYCKRITENILKKLKLNYSYVGDYITEEDKSSFIEKIKHINIQNYEKLQFKSIFLGKNIKSALIRQYRNSDSSVFEESMIKEFSYTALIVACASEKAIDKYKPAKVFMSHGVYVDWGPALNVAFSKNIPVTTYVGAYLPVHFYFRTIFHIDDITGQSIDYSTWSKIKEYKLNNIQKQRLKDFLDNRYKNCISGDMQGLLKNYQGNVDYIYEKYNLKKDKPIWALMTHITWDNVCDFFPMIFNTFDEWVEKSIEQMIKIDNVQWVIKVHPSEKNDNPQSGSQAMIKKRFPDLPEHIKLIEFDDDVSCLDFYNLIDGAITVFGTSGLELALMNKPVILAGKAHYSKKGFSYDANDQASYNKLLRQANSIGKLTKDQVELAQRYAYCYFIEREIPLVPIFNGYSGIDFSKIVQLLPNKNIYVDFICNSIVNSKEFIMEETLLKKQKNQVT